MRETAHSPHGLQVRSGFMGAVACLLALSSLEAGLVQDFSDIEMWAGNTGAANQAAFVIDWQDGRDPLAWGYRWDGSATGEDMLRAVVTADPSLYAKLGNSFGSIVFGLGYDRDQDGFGISDGTTFAANGIADNSAEPLVSASSTDADDSYREGWLTEFWGYWSRSDDNPWEFAMSGPSARILADGDWDGWSFNPDAFSPGAAPRQPVAASSTPEPATAFLLLVGVAAFALYDYQSKGGCMAIGTERRVE